MPARHISRTYSSGDYSYRYAFQMGTMPAQEMNFNNATYDVLWRVPDGGLGSTGVPCCSITDSACERWVIPRFQG